MTDGPDLTRRPRTRRVFSEDDMSRMAALYYDPAVSMHRVGAAFGVPASTMLRWVAEMDWPRRSARGRAAAADPAPDEGAPREDAQAGGGRRLMSLDAQAQARLNAPVDPAMLPYMQGRRTPSLLSALRRASQIARRELDAAAQMQPETMADRERVAALVERLSRSLARITRSIAEEERLQRWRRTMRTG